jgi:hypothetical protein
MSKVIYLITSHTLPTQVIRLIQTLRQLSPDSIIAIHHDQSKSTLLEDDVTEVKNVYLIPNPLNVEWGDISQVECFLHSIRWLTANISFDWLVLISGQDYPIASLNQFETQLSTSPFDGYFRYFPVLGGGGDAWPENTGKKRYFFKYITFPHFSYYYRIPILIQNTITKTLTLINKSGILNIIIAAKKSKNKIGIKHINAPFNDQLICYGGPDWFNLNKKCIAKILAAETENNLLLDYYKTTHIPSESFIHTLLINDSKLKISNNSMRFVNWTERYASSPSIICSSDYESIIRSKMPFARKFDMTIDNNILDKIDRHLGITN